MRTGFQKFDVRLTHITKALKLYTTVQTVQPVLNRKIYKNITLNKSKRNSTNGVTKIMKHLTI